MSSWQHQAAEDYTTEPASTAGNVTGGDAHDHYGGDGAQIDHTHLSGNGAPAHCLSGAGSPEGAVVAPVGSLFLRTDGGAGTTLYVKETGSGNTGWAAK